MMDIVDEDFVLEEQVTFVNSSFQPSKTDPILDTTSKSVPLSEQNDEEWLAQILSEVNSSQSSEALGETINFFQDYDDPIIQDILRSLSMPPSLDHKIRG